MSCCLLATVKIQLRVITTKEYIQIDTVILPNSLIINYSASSVSDVHVIMMSLWHTNLLTWGIIVIGHRSSSQSASSSFDNILTRTSSGASSKPGSCRSVIYLFICMASKPSRLAAFVWKRRDNARYRISDRISCLRVNKIQYKVVAIRFALMIQ